MRSFAILMVAMVFAVSLSAQTKPAQKQSAGTKPAQTQSAQPTATIDTTAGKMTCTLFPDKAPKGVENFVGLAEGTKDWTDPRTRAKKQGVPLYDGTIFHRVIPEFMIQGGDPAGNGTGNPGYRFANEVSADLTFDRPGRLAYANAGPDTNGSQFFITEKPTPFLDGKYTIFGQCDEATVELVKKIAREPRGRNDYPVNPVKIKHITIVQPAAAASKPAPKPAK